MTIPISWSQQYVVAVTKGRKTRYFYAEKLKEAVKLSGVKDGQGFAYAKFERGAVQWAETGNKGRNILCYGPMILRKKVA